MQTREVILAARSRGMPPEAWLLMVDSDAQCLQVYFGGRQVRRYSVSTSREGIGETQGSSRTPAGWHEVADRIGNETALGQPFESRKPVGAPLPESAWTRDIDDDRILTRILRLRGLEPGRNAGPGIDSYDRYIYLHGTNQEQRLGQPASHGCIRMANRDIAELATTLGTAPAWCWISDTPRVGGHSPVAESTAG